jgi:hypothetical protein
MLKKYITSAFIMVFALVSFASSNVPVSAAGGPSTPLGVGSTLVFENQTFDIGTRLLGATNVNQIRVTTVDARKSPQAKNVIVYFSAARFRILKSGCQVIQPSVNNNKTTVCRMRDTHMNRNFSLRIFSKSNTAITVTRSLR